MRKKGSKNISFEQRLQIKEFLDKKMKHKEIAKALGISLRSVEREMERGCVDGIYNPEVAQKVREKARENIGPPKLFEMNKELANKISDLILKEGLSVLEIIERLKKENNKVSI